MDRDRLLALLPYTPAQNADCGGRRKLVALIDQPPVVKKILAHLGLATEALTKPEDPI